MARKTKRGTDLAGSSGAAAPAKNGKGISELIKQLWQAAVAQRAPIEPSDYKRTLRKHDVSPKEFDAIVERVMDQAKALWARWPLAA